MNKTKFDPYKDMPTCDICGAVMKSFAINTPSTDPELLGPNRLVLTATFACGALWRSEAGRKFSSYDRFPNGPLEPYGAPEEWEEQESCGNAAEVIRRQRAAAKVKS